MSPINQLVVSASEHDAITSCARNARGVLQRVGPSRLLAAHVEPSLCDEIDELDAGMAPSADPLVYHASIGEAGIRRHLAAHLGPLVVWYHNITPSRYFEAYDPGFAELLDGGRADLRRLTRRAAGAMAVSEYNAADLEALGFTDVRISPLLLDTERLTGIEPDAATSEHVQQLDGPLLLFVGQLLPHKRPDLLLQAYHLLVTHHLPEAHLVLIGPLRNRAYAEGFRRLAQQLHLPRLRIAGNLTDAEMAAFHRGAAVVVTASEHEGVCVPLVEAMAFGTPIVALANAAIPETVGDGGLLLPPGTGPELLCEALLAVLEDGTLHQDLAGRSALRLRAHDRATAEHQLLANLAALL